MNVPEGRPMFMCPSCGQLHEAPDLAGMPSMVIHHGAGPVELLVVFVAGVAMTLFGGLGFVLIVDALNHRPVFNTPSDYMLLAAWWLMGVAMTGIAMRGIR